MSRSKALEKVKLTRFDDLFGGKEAEPAVEAGEVKQIPISELHEFHNHPFQIRSDEKLEEMIESVRQHGVLVPGIVRPRKEGGYEIIAGHTRRHVCELLGIDSMPVFVKDLDDDEASLIMVDSNIQRENILPSEKAKAYKIKYDAMKNQGKEGNSLQKMSEESGENYKSIQRYIWLARLNDNLLGMVDKKKLGFIQGVSLSVLSDKEQEMVYKVPGKLFRAEIHGQVHIPFRISALAHMPLPAEASANVPVRMFPAYNHIYLCRFYW